MRCAEQPATRGEGAYELARDAELVNDDADDTEDTDDTDEASVAIVELSIKSGKQTAKGNKADSGANFSALLTDKQKDRLKEALYKTTELKEGDVELLQLVNIWKDKQLVPYLVWQLRYIEADPPVMAAMIINTLAELLKDKDINDLSYEYTENASYEDLTEEESEAEEADTLEAKDDESEPG